MAAAEDRDPLLDFLELADELDKEAASSRAKKDFELWQQWTRAVASPRTSSP